MAHLIRCDAPGCDQTVRDGEPIAGWLLVRREDVTFRDRFSGPWQVCGWEHLRDLAADHLVTPLRSHS
jgi:hypothetical protein